MFNNKILNIIHLCQTYGVHTGFYSFCPPPMVVVLRFIVPARIVSLMILRDFFFDICFSLLPQMKKMTLENISLLYT